jgi:hypothetical protein
MLVVWAACVGPPLRLTAESPANMPALLKFGRGDTVNRCRQLAKILVVLPAKVERWQAACESPKLSHHVFNGRRAGYDVWTTGRALACNRPCRAADRSQHGAGRSNRRTNRTSRASRTSDVTSGFNESMKIARHWPRPSLSTRHIVSRHIVFSIVGSRRLRVAAFVATAAGLALAGCAGGGSTGSGHATAQDLLALNHMQDASGIHTRELSPEEKQIVTKAVSLSIVNPGQAQFRWPQIANTEDGSINYCGMVNAKSAYPAYSGWQAYIVEGSVTGGKLTSAVVGLIAGGKDTDIVRKMCKKYGLDPGGTS